MIKIRNIRIKIFYKILFFMLFITIGAMLWLGILLIKKSQFSLQTPINELNINATENIKNKIENKILKYSEKEKLLYNFFQKADWQNRQDIMISFVKLDPLIKEFSVADEKGLEILKINLGDKEKDELKNLSKDEFFKNALKEKKDLIKIDLLENEIVLFYPNENFNFKIVLDKKAFFSNLNLNDINKNWYFFVIDKNKNILISSEKKLNFVNLSITKQALKNLSSASMTFKDEKGNNYIGAYSYLDKINSAIVIVQSLNDAYSYALSIKKEATKIIIFFLLIVIILTYFIAKNMSVPLIRITKAAKLVSKGDFNQKVEVYSNDELKDLADTFNNMIWQLKLYSEMQIEKILKERENTQAVLFSTDDGIIMTDEEFNVQLINRKAASIINKNTQECESKNFLSIIDEQNIKDAFYEILNKKDPNFIREFNVERENFKNVYKIVLREISFPNKNKKIGYLIAIYDITMAKELERIKDEFLHSITHDLRNPMSAVKGFVEFLLKEIPGPLNEGQKKMLRSIDRASFRLLGMINNILDIAKMEAGKMQLNISEFNVIDTTKKVIELMEPLAEKKQINLEIEGPENLIIKGDSVLLERVYINLLGNAIKFTPENGKIIIGLEIKENNFISWVKDNGQGIPEEYINKLFNKFEQVKGQKTGGTGLGLTISKHIIQAHNGKIWVESPKGEGAKFIFSFPLDI